MSRIAFVASGALKPTERDGTRCRLILLTAAVLALLCGGCFNDAVIHTSECAMRLAEGPKPKAGSESQYIEVAGLRIVHNADGSLIIVFPSGRREPLGAAQDSARPDHAIIAIFAICGWIEPVHRLPAVLAADIRRSDDAGSTDALRAGWALIANDHISVHGQWNKWRFAGWLRLSNDDWMTLCDAVRHASSRPVEPTASTLSVSQLNK